MVGASLTEPSLDRVRQALIAQAPRAAVFTFAGLIVLDQGLNAWELRAALRTPPPVAVVSHQRPTLNAQQLIAASLFGTAPTKPVGDPADAPLTSADLALKGTIVGDRPEHGAAIIVARSSSRFYRVGEAIGAARLKFVYADRAVVERDGALETILMPRNLLSIAPAVLAQASGAANRHGGTFVDNQGRVVDHDPGALDRVLRLVDTYDSGGTKMRGFKVYPVADGAVLQALGLSPGDLVTAINGTELKDVGGRAQIVEALQSGSPVVATVERQGQKMTLTLSLGESAQHMGGAGATRTASADDGGST
ncbi:MAG: PDZ domain-containing protein [Proteobacteria bacterium]|nr:PDZ domain-containing protein [Pseudomonadota bacterium]